MNEPIRVGVLGASNVSRRRMLPALRDDPDTVIAAIASRDAGRAARFAADFGGDPVHSYEALLSRDDVDAVYVSVPIALHHRWALAALDAGKHVLCEKPLTTRTDDTAELVRTAVTRELVLRDTPPVLRIDEHDHADELIVRAEDQYAAGTAAFVSGWEKSHDASAATAVRTAELVDRIADVARRTEIG